MTKKNYESLGQRVGALVDVKNAAYGSSFDDAGDFLRLLYPNGIQPSQYGDALALVRIFDKMKRIATDRDALGESPYQDIAGYGLLGLRRVENAKASAQALDVSRVSTLPPPPPVPAESRVDRMDVRSNVASSILMSAASQHAPVGKLEFTGKKRKRKL